MTAQQTIKHFNQKISVSISKKKCNEYTASYLHYQYKQTKYWLENFRTSARLLRQRYAPNDKLGQMQLESVTDQIEKIQQELKEYESNIK